jgi:hypothetical protein
MDIPVDVVTGKGVWCGDAVLGYRLSTPQSHRKQPTSGQGELVLTAMREDTAVGNVGGLQDMFGADGR